MNLRSFQRGLSALILAGAPQEDIDAYFAEEGIIQDPRLMRTAKVEQDLDAMAKAFIDHIGQVSQQVNTVAAALAGEMAKLCAKVEALGVIETKVNALAKIVATKDDSEIKNELNRINRVLVELQNKPQPIIPKIDYGRIDKLEAKIIALEEKSDQQFNRLLTAKRVPEKDSFGNVKLDKNGFILGVVLEE
jgi:hypothetical protein